MKILMTTCGGFVKEMESWSERLLARELVKRGHEVEALTSKSVKKAFPDAKNKEIIDNVKVRRYNPLVPSSLIHMLKNNYDIIHAHFPGYMAPISSWACIQKKIKNTALVHTVHGIYHDPYLVKDEDPSLGINYKNIQRTFVPWKAGNWFCHLPLFASDIVLPQNSYEFNELSKLGVPKEKMIIAPTSGIDMAKYQKLPKKGSFTDKYEINKKFVLFAGQPAKRKGPEYLIRAMKNIDAQLVFIGYREDKELKKLCKELSVDARFPGFVSEQDKISAFVDASVYCLPTVYEGFGLTYLEAMACGTPIVTTNVAGVPELVENGKNGLLVAPKNEKQLTAAINKIIGNKKIAEEIGKNNRKKAAQYDWKLVAEKMEKVYTKAMNL